MQKLVAWKRNGQKSNSISSNSRTHQMRKWFEERRGESKIICTLFNNMRAWILRESLFTHNTLYLRCSSVLTVHIHFVHLVWIFFALCMSHRVGTRVVVFRIFKTLCEFDLAHTHTYASPSLSLAFSFRMWWTPRDVRTIDDKWCSMMTMRFAQLKGRVVSSWA